MNKSKALHLLSQPSLLSLPTSEKVALAQFLRETAQFLDRNLAETKPTHYAIGPDGLLRSTLS